MHYTVERNYCDCHPETCCCDTYVMKEDGKYYLSSNDKQKLIDLAQKLNNVEATQNDEMMDDDDGFDDGYIEEDANEPDWDDLDDWDTR